MVDALLIDPLSRTVSTVQITSDKALIHSEISRILVCNLQACGLKFSSGEELIIDEDGYTNESNLGFSFNFDSFFFGKALIVGYNNANGQIMTCSVTENYIRSRLAFYDYRETIFFRKLIFERYTRIKPGSIVTPTYDIN